MIIDLNEISRTSFPAGERNVVSWKNQFNPGNHPEAVRAVLRSSDDIMDLMLLTDILKRQGHPANKLILPYVPYARQDRATTEDTAFSLGVMANMINSLEYKEVHVFEPHSYVTQAVINNCVVHSSNDAIFEYMMCITNQNSDIVLVAPDASAVKKAESFNEYRKSKVPLSKELPIVVALKKRDPATGRLKCTGVYGDIPYNANLILIDDLCDGGATFLEVAKELEKSRKQCGVFILNLFVAHGIFSKGLDELLIHFNTIGTTNSYYRPNKMKWNDVYRVFTTNSI